MKPLSLSALLACAAVLAPWGAQAAMDKPAQDTFTRECIAAAKQQNLDAKTAAAHCDCGARVVNEKFTQKEIASLSNTSTAPAPELTQKLQKLVAENCAKAK
ncbi:hypothetical protein [Pseudomonas syringae]|uniref:Secreted protein n=1 Tax=Pseudomonas syringae TaxID=317 RepID=A0A9Q4FEX3_PSESX|nr:hypothetical protein [Pseudomonas syringae]KTB87397.1 hypothetical protein AO070_12775 [Pseudomonas syringae pv. syringae PD2766]MCF5467474.1 hypothetical protein [Pseudomonas syringae]MCF5474245.1 hypothetical protein [Pseudomonas syringae]MCF5483916.1 hypothetical protein [Pseudomonas syringae]MCF5488703.1 hypothetical protein [Pseudomonas syringae]